MIEPRRICGFRTVHSYYLVGQYVPISCDKLPVKLEQCKFCGGGFTFFRGVKEFNPRATFGGIHAKCKDTHRPCHICDAPDFGYLLCVGTEYSCETFVAEAIRMGVSKKLPYIPKHLKLGETIVYLAHPKACETLETTEAQMTMDTEQPKMVDVEKKIKKSLGIFCAFIPQRVEQLFHESEITDKLKEKCEKRGISIVEVPDDDQEHKLC